MPSEVDSIFKYGNVSFSRNLGLKIGPKCLKVTEESYHE